MRYLNEIVVQTSLTTSIAGPSNMYCCGDFWFLSGLLVVVGTFGIFLLINQSVIVLILTVYKSPEWL